MENRKERYYPPNSYINAFMRNEELRKRSECKELEAPPEMTVEYWEHEKREVTIYGQRDEYGGL